MTPYIIPGIQINLPHIGCWKLEVKSWREQLINCEIVVGIGVEICLGNPHRISRRGWRPASHSFGGGQETSPGRRQFLHAFHQEQAALRPEDDTAVQIGPKGLDTGFFQGGESFRPGMAK